MYPDSTKLFCAKLNKPKDRRSEEANIMRSFKIVDLIRPQMFPVNNFSPQTIIFHSKQVFYSHGLLLVKNYFGLDELPLCMGKVLGHRKTQRYMPAFNAAFLLCQSICRHYNYKLRLGGLLLLGVG